MVLAGRRLPAKARSSVCSLDLLQAKPGHGQRAACFGWCHGNLSASTRLQLFFSQLSPAVRCNGELMASANERKS